MTGGNMKHITARTIGTHSSVSSGKLLAGLILILAALASFEVRAQDVNLIQGNPELFPSMGPMMARTTVIEFADFQCPFCAMVANLSPWVGDYEDRYGPMIGAADYVQSMAEQNRVRFIFVPLSFLNNGTNLESTWAAQAAFCAQDQGLFWEMHHTIFAASDNPQENTGKYSKDNLKVLAASIEGMDTASFNTCLDSDATLQKTQDVMNAFFDAGFQLSTPQFWVNDQRIESSLQALQTAIEGQ